VKPQAAPGGRALNDREEACTQGGAMPAVAVILPIGCATVASARFRSPIITEQHMESTQDAIFAIIAKEAHIPVEKISLESTLKDLEIDSLDVVQIIFELEDRFGITLPDRDPTVDTDSVRGLVAAVERLVAEKAASSAPSAS
jgi:acyl carrier protein